MVKEHRVFNCMAYLLLAERLSSEELTCISHCLVFDDCAADGDCELQDKANKIVLLHNMCVTL